MINLLTRLAELDNTNPNVINPMNAAESNSAKEQAIAENKTVTTESNDFELNVQSLKFLAGVPEVLEECGMSSSSPASINITAGSSEELGSMLKSIMNLAGVQPAAQALNAEPESAKDDTEVMRSMLDTMNDPSEDESMEMGGAGAGDEGYEQEGMLGALAGGATGLALGGPMAGLLGAAAGDQLTDSDADDHAEEDMLKSHKHPMRQMMDKMEEDPEYDNTPADPTKPEEFDSNKFAHDPNRGDHRERQAGLPRAKPMEEHVANLFNDYQKFVAEAKPSAGMTKKEKSAAVKKAKSGADMGKPGKGFEKIVNKAKDAGYSEKQAKATAGAQFWKKAAKK